MSSLNVIGVVMITLAIFKVACWLETYIFVDTTDRMDLTLVVLLLIVYFRFRLHSLKNVLSEA